MKLSHQIFSFLLIICCGFQSSTNEQIQIFSAGMMHRQEVKGKNHEEWFGLYELPAGYSLIKSTITVSAIHDTNDLYDTEVSVDQTLRPHFLVRGSERFTEGFVKTVYRGSTPLQPKSEFRFLWEGIWYSISASGVQNGEEIKNYEIKYIRDGISQRIVLRPNTSGDGLPSILWIGDLDRDNKPDLLIDMTDHYNVSEPTLFLTSSANKKEFVHRAAFYRSTGC